MHVFIVMQNVVMLTVVVW